MTEQARKKTTLFLKIETLYKGIFVLRTRFALEVHLLIWTANKMVHFSPQTKRSYVVTFEHQGGNLHMTQTMGGKLKFGLSSSSEVIGCLFHHT